MSTTQENEEKNQSESSEKSLRTQVEKLRSELKVTSARARAEEKNRLKLEETLAQSQASLQEALDQAETERQLRLQAEQALSEEQIKPVATRDVPAGSVAESRLVFVLRLSLDENRQPKRVEIEENQTRRKDSIPGLDSGRILAFIQTFLPPPREHEGQRIAEAPIPLRSAAEIEPRPQIVVANVQVGNPQDLFNRLVYYPHDRVQIRVHFNVENPDVLPVADQDEGFEIKMHARNRQDETYQLLASVRVATRQGVAQYVAELELRNLLPGLYSLFTVVAHPTARLAGFFEGPVFEVPNPRIKEVVRPDDYREQINSPN